MFCPKCGKEIPNQATFCPKCGAALSGAAKSAAPEPPPPAARGQTATATAVKPKKKGKKKFILAIAAAVIVLFAAVSTFGGSSGAPEDQTGEEDPTPNPNQEEITGPASEQEADLLAIIDEAETAREKVEEEFVNLDDETQDTDGDGLIDDLAFYEETCRHLAQTETDFLAELEEQRGRADAVSGLDAKLVTAKNEYFNMLHDFGTTHIEALAFMADYMAFFDETVSYRPLVVDYDTPSDYVQELSAWLDTVREGYAAISYPTSVASEWTEYGEILEYNAGIVKKYEQAIGYDDWLRFDSAANLSNRYHSAESNQYEKILSSLGAETLHAGKQLGSASDLAEEMRAYVEMAPEMRETYEFQNIFTNKILLSYDVVDTIYPSLYNTYDAFAIFRTGCISGTRSIVVEAEIEGFTQQYRESFNLDSSYKAIYIKPPALTGELDLTAAKPAQLKITISDRKDGTLIAAKDFPITLKSKYDFEWYSNEYGSATQDNILCLLTPEAKAIVELKRAAIDEISAMTGNSVQSFVGYQPILSSNYATTYIQVAGLMRALYDEMGVRYNMNPFSISGSNQHIQFPEDVIANRSGLCVETSLVIASALQSANMHAFLVFPPGHAQVAVEVWNSGTGAGEYYLIETTALNENNNRSSFVAQCNAILRENVPPDGIITYYSSDEWYDYLQNNVDYIVDCDDSQLLGMTPFAN